MKNSIIILILALTINNLVTAQKKISDNVLQLNENSTSPASTLNDIKWIVGHWEGEALDGKCEETWLPAHNGRMIGTFRMTETKKFKFFAFSTIMEQGNSLEMRVKHFNYNFEGWEEKDRYIAFPLVKVEKNKIYFDGVTMEKIGDDRLNVYMSIKYRNGTVREEKYSYQRTKI
ncbi:DUF6265 family protein [Winogradskyella sp. 3972H.M.0a.05]|uniref:DUF6265 family protein n=1 Tax=Winogradskyella sp. 3972H.M.0a.05 TaxID=2950277 RepID=UPI003395B70A